MLLNEFLERSAEAFPDKEALVSGKRRLSFSEVELQANSIANGLLEEGLQRHDRAAIYLDNSLESIVSIFGILKAGGIFLVVNPQVKMRKLEYILNDCQAKILITDNKHLHDILTGSEVRSASGKAGGYPSTSAATPS